MLASLIGLARPAGLLGGVDQLGAAAVVEGDGEHHAGVVPGVVEGLADRLLHVLRRARLGAVERSAHPLDAHVQLVQFGDASEQLLVQAEDVADLGARAHPVLGREPEHGEPADVAGDGDPHEAQPGSPRPRCGPRCEAGCAASPTARCRP